MAFLKTWDSTGIKGWVRGGVGGVWFLSKEIQGKVHGGMETAVTATAYSE